MAAATAAGQEVEEAVAAAAAAGKSVQGDFLGPRLMQVMQRRPSAWRVNGLYVIDDASISCPAHYS